MQMTASPAHSQLVGRDYTAGEERALGLVLESLKLLLLDLCSLKSSHCFPSSSSCDNESRGWNLAAEPLFRN